MAALIIPVVVPPGYHFEPSDEELIKYFLLEKALGRPLRPSCIVEKQLYGENANPWDVFDDVNDPWETEKTKSDTKKTIYVLTKLSKISTGGKRVARRAGCGSWSGQTGANTVYDSNGISIGSKKMFCFETTKKGDSEIIKKTHGHWIMHEYSLDGAESLNNIEFDRDYVICRITRASNKGRDLAFLGSEKRSRAVDDYPDENKKARTVLPIIDDVLPTVQDMQDSSVAHPSRFDDCGQWLLDDTQEKEIDISDYLNPSITVVDDFLDRPDERQEAGTVMPNADDHVPQLPISAMQDSSAQIIDPSRFDDCGQWLLDDTQEKEIDISDYLSPSRTAVDDFPDRPDEKQEAGTVMPNVDDHAVPQLPISAMQDSSAQIIDPSRFDDCGQWLFDETHEDIDISDYLSPSEIECMQWLIDEQPQIDTQFPSPSMSCFNYTC